MRRVQHPVDVLLWDGVSNGSVTVLGRDENEDVFFCTGTSAPSAKSGYAVGCIFIDTATGILYSNLGSTTSCVFYAAYGASPSPSSSVSPSSSLSPSASVSPSSSESPSESPSLSPSPSVSPSSSESPSVSPSTG